MRLPSAAAGDWKKTFNTTHGGMGGVPLGYAPGAAIQSISTGAAFGPAGMVFATLNAYVADDKFHKAKRSQEAIESQHVREWMFKQLRPLGIIQ